MKNLFITLMLSFMAGFSFSQSLIHTKGKQGIGLSAHLTEFGYAINGNYLNFIKEKYYLKGSINYEYGEIGFTEFDNFLLMPSFGFSPYNLSNKLYLNIEGGALIGFENIREKFDYPNTSTFIYGFSGALELEYFISTSISIKANFNQMYALNSLLGNFRYQAGIGFNFYL